MTLARYIIREHIAPFFYALAVITFLFLIDFLIRILSSILQKGLEPMVVLEILVLNLAWMLALSIPMAVLVSTLMAFGRLSSDNEVTALKALGISPLKAMRPVFILGIFLAGGLTWFNDQVLPEANYRAAALRNDIGRKKPTALIAEKQVIKDFDNHFIWIDHIVQPSGTLHGIRLYQHESGKPLRFTYADSGSVEYANGGQTLLIHLEQGENHLVDTREDDNYVRVRFKKQTIALENVDASLERHERTYRTDREMSVEAMLEVVKASKQRLASLKTEYEAKIFDDVKALDVVLKGDTVPPPPRLLDTLWWKQSRPSPLAVAGTIGQEKEKLYHIERYERRVENEQMEISQYDVEIHKKFAIPFAVLIFIFIGAPLGIMARRGGIGTGVIYSLGLFIMYWAFMIRGEALADKLSVAPWFAMWGPNLILGCVGIFLVWVMIRDRSLAKISLPFRKKGLNISKTHHGPRLATAPPELSADLESEIPSPEEKQP